MFSLSSEIKIGKWKIPAISSVEIKSSWQNLTDTATIAMPPQLRWQGRPIVVGDTPLFKRGDFVSIKLGYNDKLERVFTGYISDVKVKSPLEIECEDSMWLLKQVTVSKSWPSLKLSELVSYLQSEFKKSEIYSKTPSAKDISFETTFTEMTLGKLRVPKQSIAQVLDYLKKQYNVYSFFRGNTLYIGLAYVPKLRAEKKFVIGSAKPRPANETQANVISHYLQYRRKDDVKIKVTGISINSNNTKIEYNGGDPEGEQRTLHFYNLDMAALKHVTDTELEKLKYEGYRGKIVGFGRPFVRHNDAIQLENEDIPDHNGTYLVKTVEYKFGIEGYRQEINIDVKVL